MKILTPRNLIFFYTFLKKNLKEKNSNFINIKLRENDVLSVEIIHL